MRPDATDAVLREGQTAVIRPGEGLRFERMLLWNRYLVRGDPARWITFLGFWMCVAGMAWRFLVPERRLAVFSDASGTMRMHYRARPWLSGVIPGDEAVLRWIRDTVRQGG